MDDLHQSVNTADINEETKRTILAAIEENTDWLAQYTQETAVNEMLYDYAQQKQRLVTAAMQQCMAAYCSPPEP